MRNIASRLLIPIWFCLFLLIITSAPALDADLIFQNGKILAVDSAFSIHSAMAVREGSILAVGADEVVLKNRGPKTQVVNLEGKMVLPGLIDSHAHAAHACMTEFEHPIPDMETIQDVLDYLATRARNAKPGEWIELRQVFI